MELYSLYEFPPDISSFNEVLSEIDRVKVIEIDNLENVVSRIFGKRPSRTKILIKDLRKLGFIEGNEKVSLSWETQMYLTTKNDLRGLILLLTYQIPILFQNCIDILQVDPAFDLSNPSLIKSLHELGYKKEKLTTSREKIYAIKRLINLSKDEPCRQNHFKDFQVYIDSLQLLEQCYLKRTNNKWNENVIISELQEEYEERKDAEQSFSKVITSLFYDPVFASFTSFSTVVSKFAHSNYFKLDKEVFYYIKIKENFIEFYLKKDDKKHETK